MHILSQQYHITEYFIIFFNCFFGLENLVFLSILYSKCFFIRCAYRFKGEMVKITIFEKNFKSKIFQAQKLCQKKCPSLTFNDIKY